MSDRTITQNIFVLSDGDHAVFETGSQDTITVVPGISVQTTGVGGKGILTDGFGDDVLVQGSAESFQDVAIEVGTSGDDASGGNSVTVVKNGNVFGSLAAISLHGDGNRVDNAGNIVGDVDGLVFDGEFCTVVNVGAVRAESGSAILATDDDMTIANGGFVSGRFGVFVQGGNDAAIVNTGTINADQAGIVVEGEGASIQNTGTISALNGIGVFNSDAIDATVPGVASIVNSGLVNTFQLGLVGVGDDILIRNTAEGEVRTISTFDAAVRMDTAAGESQKFVNDGLVDAKGTAVDGGLGNETVINRGAIKGTILLDGGDDVYDGRGGGTVAGVIDGGNGDDRLFGGAGNDRLTGGAGVDRLLGAAGADVLTGGAGSDLMTGGLGADAFIFNSALNAATNLDRITDFSVIQDTIKLDDAVFTALGGPGALDAGAFFVGSAAHDGSDRIVYNPDTGALIYDANGSAAGGATQFATLSSDLALTHADFVLF